MANDDFFSEPVQPVVEETPIEKIRVGEDEYTQDELQKLVGLGKIGVEAESKYKTNLTKVWPKMQQVINEKKELEQKYQEMADRNNQSTNLTLPNQQLTTDQIRAEAIRQAEELGIGPQAVRRTVMEVIQGQQLINDISGVIDEMQGEGLPSTTVEDIIAHMQETGIRNPEKAYRDMFEKEWLNNQNIKINQIKSKGLPTVSQSTAGGKVPAPIRITNDNLEQTVADALKGSYE